MTQTAPDPDYLAEPLHPGLVQYVDPRTLTVDSNIRSDPRLDEAFLDSVETYGVLVAIHVRLDPIGQPLILDGQRRVLAALQKGLEAVPVLPVDGIGDEEARVRVQWNLNEHRTGLTPAERADAVGQMALFGRSPATIAKALAAPPEEVDAALAVSGAPAARQLLDAQPALDLVTTAKLAEFADDPDLPALAAKVADAPDRVDHILAFARQDRAVAAAIAAKGDELADSGFTVIERVVGARLSMLSTTPPAATGPIPDPISSAEHAACPHRAARVQGYWEDGAARIIVNEYCLDPEVAGHHIRHVRPDGGPVPAAAAAAADVDQDEAAVSDRSHTLAQNRASDAARDVRIGFIRELTGRLRLPDDAVQHAVMVCELAPAQFTGWGANDVLRGWHIEPSALPARAARSPREATLVLLQRALACAEHLLERDFWRIPPRYGPRGEPEVRVLHLQALAMWGYTLADIETDWLNPHDGSDT